MQNAELTQDATIEYGMKIKTPFAVQINEHTLASLGQEIPINKMTSTTINNLEIAKFIGKQQGNASNNTIHNANTKEIANKDALNSYTNTILNVFCAAFQQDDLIIGMGVTGQTMAAAKYDLTLFVQDEPRACYLRAEYDSACFTKESIAQWLNYLQSFMETVTTSQGD